MQKRKKTGGRDFKAGESGNPGGAIKIPEALKEARKLNRVQLEIVLNKYMHMTSDESSAAANDPTTVKLDRIILKVIELAEHTGDFRALAFLLDRLGFVVTQDVRVSGGEGGPITFSALSEAELDERIKRLTEKL
ncbi:MAG: terminase small subunit [Mu-like cryoconite phage AB09]|nr:MAG: terminase small subunit [Mu-like cryoconite phage AB09]